MKVFLFGLFLGIGATMGTPIDPPAPLIVGGTEASKGEFPHLVQIKLGNSHHCGGSIVNANWVVTSAQCASASESSYTLVAGEHNLHSDEGSEQTRKVAQIIRHPDYVASTYNSDIAVMRVDQPFNFDEFVQPVAIPDSGFSPANQLTTAGWGSMEEGGDYPITLRKVTLPIVANGACREAYGNRILAGMLCAGEDRKASCQGDTGGALMSDATLVGTVSWSFLCGSPTYPGVYSDVRYFSTWIKNVTR